MPYVFDKGVKKVVEKSVNQKMFINKYTKTVNGVLSKNVCVKLVSKYVCVNVLQKKYLCRNVWLFLVCNCESLWYTIRAKKKAMEAYEYVGI